MNTLTSIHHGVASRAQLHALGHTDHTISAHLANGSLYRLRHGWFARPGATPKVVRAVQSGGVLTGSDALALHGAWDLNDPLVNVRVHQLSRIRQDHGVRPHTLVPSPSCREAVDPVEVSLQVLLRGTPREDAVVVCDSVLNRRLMSQIELEALAARLGSRGFAVISRVDSRAESGSESRFRLWAQSHNISLRSQVSFRESERLDFVIGRSLVVECDSVAHHTSMAAYQRDRERDLALKSLGYEVVRLTYHQVLQLDAGVGARILNLIRRGVHLREVPSLTRSALTLATPVGNLLHI